MKQSKSSNNSTTSTESCSSFKSIQLLKDNSVIQLLCNIKPGAKESKIASVASDEVGIQIAAPPVDGEANAEVIKFLSKLFHVRKSNVTILIGAKSRSKIVQIEMDYKIENIEQVQQILKAE